MENIQLKSHLKVFFSKLSLGFQFSVLALSGSANMPTGISYEWETYPAFPKLSVIVLYIVRDSIPMLYVWLYCSLTLFSYIFACLYIFLGWCSPSMWPLVLYQSWLFVAKYFSFILFPELPYPKVVLTNK